MKDIVKDNFVPLSWRGIYQNGHAASRIAIGSETYIALKSLARTKTRREGFGALVGTVQHWGQRGAGYDLTTITRIVPMRLVTEGLDLVPDPEQWAALDSKLDEAEPASPISEQAAGAAILDGPFAGHAESIVGWFYSDPGVTLFPPRVNIAQARAMLAPYTTLLLLVNPATDEGAFYTFVEANDGHNDDSEGRFTPTGGFYEVLASPDDMPVIAWNGEVEGAANWLGLEGQEDSTGVSALETKLPENAVAETPALVAASEVAGAAWQSLGAAVFPSEPASTSSLEPAAEPEDTGETGETVAASAHTSTEAQSWLELAPTSLPSPTLSSLTPPVTTDIGPLPELDTGSTGTATIAEAGRAVAPAARSPKRPSALNIGMARRVAAPAVIVLLAVALAGLLALRGSAGGTSTTRAAATATLPANAALFPATTPTVVKSPTPHPTNTVQSTATAIQTATTVPTAPVTVVGGSNIITVQDSAFHGGYTFPDYLYKGRSAHLIYRPGGAQQQSSSVTASFNLNISQGKVFGPVNLNIVGLDSARTSKSTVRITVNGTTVYAGADPLPGDTAAGGGNWGTYTWQLDTAYLKQGVNTLTIANTGPGGSTGSRPFVAVDYFSVSWDQNP